MWWKRNRRKLIAPILVAAVLAAAFWYGGDAPGLRGWTTGGAQTGETSTAGPDETADQIFTILMGEQVEPRKQWIEQNAKYVVNLDI